MVNKYLLKNPYLKGKLDKTIEAKNSKEAANILYQNISEHFNNSLPEFHFSFQKGSNKEKLFHFKVKESRNDNNEVSYKISPFQVDDLERINNFHEKLSEFKKSFNKEGGAKKKSKKTKKNKKKKIELSESDSDSDSSITSGSSDYYKRVKSYLPLNQPIYYWWYDPYLYPLNKLYIPTFYSYITPYIELNLKPSYISSIDKTII